jgi:N-acetylmuramoyl-L-alanine amidase
MRRIDRAGLLALAASAALLAYAAPAHAQAPPAGVTLKASRTIVTYGNAVVLSGKVSPEHAGEQVQIINEVGEIVAEATTNEDGHYSVKYSPSAIATLRAQWLGAISDPVKIKVRPDLDVRIRGVQLFARARVSGTLRPAHKGARITVHVFRNGHRLLTRKTRLMNGRRFSIGARINRPGTYRARASFDDDDHLAASSSTRSARAAMPPSLSLGARSKYVYMLEKRLRSLGYHFTGINERYDARTSDAVIAFHKVQGMERSGSVSGSTWQALTNPARPRPRREYPRFHIEIDQTKQVIYTVRRGRIENILHTSTGAAGATRDGTWRVHRKLAGYSGGGLYYPSYFDGLRAIHGWSEVPTYPASHGCARVPMWAAQWIYGLADIGTQVVIYH